jgi:hypothetical protein
VFCVRRNGVALREVGHRKLSAPAASAEQAKADSAQMSVLRVVFMFCENLVVIRGV